MKIHPCLFLELPIVLISITRVLSGIFTCTPSNKNAENISEMQQMVTQVKLVHMVTKGSKEAVEDHLVL